MCITCLNEERPDRGTMCLDTGAYVVNFKACSNCGKRDKPCVVGDIMREQEEDSDGEETEEISFKHGCVECGHVIGEHFYREITEASGVTRFLMECPLCGKGAHEKPSYSTPSTSAEADECVSGGGDDATRSTLVSIAKDAMFDAVRNQVELKLSVRRLTETGGMAAAADAAARQVGGEGIIEDEADEWAEEEN